MKSRQNADVLPSMIELKGKKVADIGCGDGSLTRLMTRHGADVIGVEPSQEQLERARAAKPAGNEIYTEGQGEDLSFKDNKLDLVVFFNSLHHIPIDSQDKALSEAARVLKPGGMVYISEPMAEGEHFELMKPVHDETSVRNAACKAIGKAAGHGLTPETETTYLHQSLYPDYDTFRNRIQAINPGLDDDFDKLEKTLKNNFDSLGHKTEEGTCFGQPMQVNLLVKTG
ncbi:MAG: class I SAM-dependent methyltransferase [Rhodospirillaceae bacterium]|jgi:ubiquinone/menaquinone biosynthesis C-methylase UbiE|nr:class I SAM-dependent methyltransferase [Rhodospirillaceae bacterium]MBT5243453.1 class I SAM-dependent methyltransferase [Rhodospirillaceae bacterium]MBT5562041.1 class I SAM-dependent methyltransferase [Rhodospirillaceae bacterium]MBT6242214.1 class I SAM-dependent methyltransferase [Rhodospirillaceae bacterium]MBT7136246.1 class I SAM-dependent methyltransferase [Rhodospirillaceae bacterium]